MSPPEYDLFVSHASEDKPGFVRPLANILRELGISVWYDEFTLKVGDSISTSINKGLSQSRFGLVVISQAFINKPWPKAELEGLSAVAITKGSATFILPIWHGVSHSDVLAFSPILADKVAIRTGDSDAAGISLQILQVIRPDLYSRLDVNEFKVLVDAEDAKTLRENIAESLKGRIRRICKDKW